MRERVEDDSLYCAAADAFVRLSDATHGARAVCDAVDASARDGGGVEDDRWVEGTAGDGREKAADASARVAEKLLMGWTLTGETCPMTGCHTPLVRSRGGEMFCARHEMYVRDARDAARASKSSAGAAAAANASNAAVASVSVDRAALSDSERRTLRALEAKAEAAREAFERETDAARSREWLALLDDLHASMKRLGAPRDG